MMLPSVSFYRCNQRWCRWGVGAARLTRGYPEWVRLATWNVNSVKQRVPRLLPWLDERQPDVVCLQETKLADDAFKSLLGVELERRGYSVAVLCEVQRIGVVSSSLFVHYLVVDGIYCS